MSYILDALKKTEREKARKERHQGGMTGITGELFRDDAPEPSGTRITSIVLVVLIVALSTAAATWYVLKGGTSRQKAAATPAPAAVPVADAPSPAPAAVSPPSPPGQTVAPGAPPVPSPAPPSAAPMPSRSAPPVQPARIAPGPATVSKTAKQRADATPGSSMEEKQPVQQPLAAVTAPPVDIKVSGIAWQDDRPARRAVVNGALLREGSTVAGARVVEIQQDRIRFSLEGRSFEVPLLAAGIPAQRQQ